MARGGERGAERWSEVARGGSGHFDTCIPIAITDGEDTFRWGDITLSELRLRVLLKGRQVRSELGLHLFLTRDDHMVFQRRAGKGWGGVSCA